MKPPTFHPCWLTIPAERSAAFLPTFVRMSVAVQRVLRERVPMEYFENLGKYRDLRTAGPMLFRRSKPKLVELLAQAESSMRAEGLAELADQYAPRRTGAILDCVQKLS